MIKQKYHVKYLKKMQVNVPFHRLKSEYLPLVIELGINPEIGIDAQVLDTTSVVEFEKIAEILKRYHRKITLHGPFMDLVPGGLDAMLLAATRKRLKRFFEIIPLFEPKTVVCHTGYDPSHYRENWEKWLSNSVATWEPCVNHAEQFGFRLLLENVYERNPEVHSALFHAIQSKHFGFCLDVGHQNVFGESPLEEWIETLHGKIMELHLHDNNGAEDSHWAIGDGNIDFTGLFQQIEEKSLRPVITLEPHEEETLWQSLASVCFKEFIEKSF